MKRFVVDANVAVKWYLTEYDSDVAARLLELDAEFHAPAFLRTEFASIFWKHTMAGLTSIVAWRQASASVETAIQHWHNDDVILERAIELAIEQRHHVFDCIYLALALVIDGVVVTADKAFHARFAKSVHSARIVALGDAASR